MQIKNVSLDGTSFLKNRFFAIFGPSTFYMIANYVVLLADTLIVANFVGSTAVSAISILLPLVQLSISLAQVSVVGAAWLYARQIGKFRKDAANRIFGQGLIVVAFIAVLQLAIFTFLKDPYIDYMGISDAVRVEVENYWKYEKFMLILYPLSSLLIETVHFDSDHLTSTLAKFVQICCSTFLSFALASKMGTAGASLGNFIGISLALLICLTHFFKKSNTLHPVLFFNWRMLRKTVTLASTDAMPHICWALLNLCLNKMILSQYSDAYLPVLAVLINILEITLIFDSVVEDMSPIAEIYMGEKNYIGERELAEYGLRVTIVEGFLALELLFILAPIVPPLYGISSPEIASVCVSAIRILSLSLPFTAIIFFFAAQFRIVRKTGISVLLLFIAQFVSPIFFALVLSNRFGFKGIWYSFIIGYVVTIVLAILYILIVYGKSKFPWLCPDNVNSYLNISFILSKKTVIEACDLIDAFLKENNVPESIQHKARKVFEETGMLIFNDNRLSESVAEFTIGIESNGVYLITRDTGKQRDITQEEGEVGKLLSTIEDKHYLTSTGFNRYLYRLPYED